MLNILFYRPEPCRPVGRCRGEIPAVAAEGSTVDRPRVPFEHCREFAFPDAPKPYGAINVGRREPQASGLKAMNAPEPAGILNRRGGALLLVRWSCRSGGSKAELCRRWMPWQPERRRN